MSNVRRGTALAIDPRQWSLYERRIGRAIRDRRLELDLSRGATARAAGIAEDTLVQIEDCVRRDAKRTAKRVVARMGPTLRTLYLIARALDTSLLEILP